MNPKIIETLTKARAWCVKEYSKRSKEDTRHPSFLAGEILAEAEGKFAIPSYGVEGYAFTSVRGMQYLNFGDPYDATIVVTSNPTMARFWLASGGWAGFAK